MCHDGAFSTLTQWSTDELFFSEHDFGGTLWDNREGYEKWDPASHTKNWATPMLVLHNELDYRLTVGEGLAMFNVLQTRKVPSKLVVFPDENHVSDRIMMINLCMVRQEKRLADFSSSIVGVEAGELTRLAQGGAELD